MSRPLWFVHLIKKAFAGRFFAAKTTKMPVLGNLIDRWLFEGDHLIYLPQDHLIKINQPLESYGEVVLPSRVVEHFIQQANTHWVMNACICREASACDDYPIDLGCLFLGQAASGIAPELGRPVTREEALEHVQRCREAGLIHLIGRNKLDTVWLGVGPGEKLLTICNCCPCCCLWRVLPYVAPQISAKITAMSGVSVSVADGCSGCGTCTHDVCFVNAIHLLDGRASISCVCKGCGRCVDVCPQGAIRISIENEQFLAESIARIAPLVDVT